MKNKDLKWLFISAVIPKINIKEFSSWLCNEENNCISSPLDLDGKDWQPTRRLIGSFFWDVDKSRIKFDGKTVSNLSKIGSTFINNIIESTEYTFIKPETSRINKRKFPKLNNKAEVAVELGYQYSKDGPVLIFCSTTVESGGCEGLGKSFLKMAELKEIQEIKEIDLNHLESFLEARIWLGEDSIITKCLKYGIGIHYSSIPQSVRKAIEKDFREKKLKILIATNTIGGYTEGDDYIQSYVSVRDFWNIVGRAGRAGKETEGQIIFITLTKNDKSLFKKYTSQLNIESSKSILYLVLKEYLDRRLTVHENLRQRFLSRKEAFSNLKSLRLDLVQYIKELIEPSLIDMIIEESVGSPDSKIIENIVSETLFKVQSLDLNIKPVVRALFSIKKAFFEMVPDPSLRKTFSSTGFMVNSCKLIHDYILSEIVFFKDQLENYNQDLFIEKIISCLITLKEMKPEYSNKLPENFFSDYFDLIVEISKKWIKGEKIGEIRELWNSIFSNTHLESQFNYFIEDVLIYRYSWGISVFLSILSNVVKKKMENLRSEIKNLPLFIKYGLDNEISCWGMNFGIASRESANIISDLYLNRNPKYTFPDFIKWFSNLSYEEIKDIFLKNNLSQYEIDNIHSLLEKVVVKNKHPITNLNNLKCFVKGIPFEEERIALSKDISVGDHVELIRDKNNIYDTYAIMVIWNSNNAGFIPRELARPLSMRMDLFNERFFASIIKKEAKNNYFRLELQITRE